MANQKATFMTIGIPGVEVIIWYSDANNRVGSVEWNMPIPGIACRIRIWDSNISTTVPVIDRTVGQGSGAESIPGSYRMIATPDGLDLPLNITYAFNIETIGG